MTEDAKSANLPVKIDLTLEQATLALAKFLAANPSAKLEEDPKVGLVVKQPWDDASIALRIPKQDNITIIDALNAVVLPERLSAIYHPDTRRLEVIWTAFKLTPSQTELVGRTFNFSYRGGTHKCHFGIASDRLIAIAKSSRPQGTSNTDYRNLQPFSFFASVPKEERSNFSLDDPRAFWVENIDYNEASVLELISDLNFYLLYFDAMSPFVLIHEPPAEATSTLVRTRYIHGGFPTDIAGRQLNRHLTSYFSAASVADPMMKFILYYRILEYASHSYIEKEIREAVGKVIATPHLSTKMPEAIERIAELFSGKMEDVPRFKQLIKKAVEAHLVWVEIQANKSAFTGDTVFDGGFRLKALIHEKDTEEQFAHRGMDSLCDNIRRIRNALAHGRDQETGATITPTTRNLQLLRPWNHVMEAAAAEVLLYKDVV